MRDQSNTLKIIPVISPAAYNNQGTTPWVGTVVDTLGYDSLTFVIQTGTLSDANATYAITMDDGAAIGVADGAVDAAYLVGTYAGAGFTFAGDDMCYKIGYTGTKRYVRLTVTPTGADSGNSPISVLAILGHPRVHPMSDQSLAS